MTDYSKYPYGQMLSYVERRCKELNEDKNYVEYILSMERAESIERLIKLYGNCYKVLAYLFYGSKTIPSNWFVTDTWGYKNGWLVDELNYCLNENILRWYKRQENITDEQAIMCISNLRNAINTQEIETKILSTSNPNVDCGIGNLSRIRNSHHKIRKGFQKEYIKSNYVPNLACLVAHGYILDAVDTSIGKISCISYDNLIEIYNKPIEERKKREEEKQKKIKKERTILFVVLLCSILATVVSIRFRIAMLVAFTSCAVIFSFAALIMHYIDNSRSSKKRINDELEYQDSREGYDNKYAYNVMNEVGEIGLSFLLSLPFAFFGGIFRSMGKRR